MQYHHSKDKAEELSQQALDRIRKDGLKLIPQTFELWYAYFSGENPDVIRAIDLLEAKKQTITNEKCDEIYNQFLNRSTQEKQVTEAGHKVQDTIQAMGSQVDDIKSANIKYKKALEEASERLSGNIEMNEIRETLDTVVSSTNDVIARNAELEQELERSSSAMKALQKDLEMVRKQALLDGLTNLANRRAFEDKILQIIEDSESSGQAFSLLIIDIDHFKSFNDTYGHQVGDQVLRLVSRTLIEGVKGRDFPARYGGEEFAVILPETNIDAAVRVGESLRKVIAGKELINRNSGEVLGRVTISGGVAQYVSGEAIENLIERADTALYTAKHNGRNQVTAAPMPSQKYGSQAKSN